VATQQIWGSRNYHNPTIIVRLNLNDIHRPVSTCRFWVYYEVKRTVIKRSVEPSLSVCSML